MAALVILELILNGVIVMLFLYTFLRFGFALQNYTFFRIHQNK